MAKYQGRGSKTANKIIAKSVKEQGGRAAAAKNAVKAGAKAAVFAYNPNKVAKAAKAARAAVTVKKTGSGIKKTGTISRASRTESTSYRGKELSKAERKEILKQNKAAETLKSRDLDRVESGRKAAVTRKEREIERQEAAYVTGNIRGTKRGRAQGAVATAVLGGAAYSLEKKREREKKNSKKKK